jgi:hypothetical protein
MASRSKCQNVPTDQLESVVNEICADDESGDEIMISELDEIDSDNNTVIDSDEHLATTSAMPNTSISWTYGDIVPTIVPFTSSYGIKIHISHKMGPFSWIKTFLDDNLVNHITTETNRYAQQHFNTYELAAHSREYSYKDVTSDEMWIYLGIVFMTGIDKHPEIETTDRADQQHFNTYELAALSQEHNYKYVTSDEMWIYLAIVFMTGIEKHPEIEPTDRADQMLRYYPSSRKTVKWTKKLVFFLLQMATLNSFILFKKEPNK